MKNKSLIHIIVSLYFGELRLLLW